MAERTPLHDLTAKAGAAFAEDAGWLMPARYGDAAAEYAAARGRVALFDVSHCGKVELNGPDAASFLHNLCTNEVNKLPLGSGCEAFFTTGQARVVSFALIYRVAPDVSWLDLAPGTAGNVVTHLEHFHITERFEIADRTAEYAQVHLAGPQALGVLRTVGAGGIPDLGELHHARLALVGVECHVRRHEPLGLPGFDLICSRDAAGAVWEALADAGAAPAGLETYEILRVEAGTPVYGVDIDETNLPQEVGRTDRAVSFTKGCYIGQETVARIRTYGHVNRSLMGLRIAEKRAAPAGSAIYRAGAEVGRVTSSVVSPLVGSGIALAYVRRGSQEQGTAAEVEIEGIRRAAEVVALPFGAGVPEK
jgi:glycine cleavage system T protein